MTVEARYLQWLMERVGRRCEAAPDQRQWLDAVKDHIAQSLAIEQEDFEDVPFSQFGGLGKAHELFGDRLPFILNELNERFGGMTKPPDAKAAPD